MRTQTMLVIIDSGIDNPQQLAQGVLAGAHVVILKPDQDGIAQIDELLQHHADLTSLHIISHGSPGSVYLGNSQLSLSTLDHYAPTLQAWSVPQLLFYGCNVAAGDAGAEFIEAVSALTGANVAASTTVTGHAELGGNWDLDVATHNTPLALAFGESVKEWQGALNVTINPTGGSLADGSDGLRIILTSDGSYGIVYKDSDQVYGGTDSTTAIGIGGATVGSSYGSFDRVWDTLNQTAVLGAGSQANPFTVTTTLFDDLDNDDVYDVGVETKLDYSVAYVLGNPYFSQTFQITLPDNNTDVIKFYQGMDTLLAGGDAGPAYGLNGSGAVITGTSDNPVLIGTVKNLGQPGESFLAYVQSGRAWDSWYSGRYNTQFGQVTGGGNLVKTYDTDPDTDNGIGVQYDLGVATGVVTISNKLTFDASTAIELAQEAGGGGNPISPTSPVLSDGNANNGNEGLTNNNQPSLQGSVTPGSTIEIFANGQPVSGAVTVNPNGTWSFTPTSPFADGTYQLFVRATPSGGSPVDSPVSTLTIDTLPATVEILDFGANVRDTSINAINFRFSELVNNVNLSDLELTFNGQPVDLTNALLSTQDNQTFTLENIPGFTVNSGNYQISIKPSSSITDRAGNALTIGGSDSWLTGYTADASAPQTFKGGKPGLKNFGSGDGDAFRGGRFNDAVRGGGGNDKVQGRGGNDTISGGGGQDNLTGGLGKDRVRGQGGNDRLLGRQGKDLLLGGGGNDRILAGGGDDVIVGGTGNDILTGGRGSDAFKYNFVNEGTDTITDFNASVDLIDLRTIFNDSRFAGPNRFAQFNEFIDLVQVGSTVEVRIDADGSGSGTALNTLAVLNNQSTNAVTSRSFIVG